jgi:hypothetical protein
MVQKGSQGHSTYGFGMLPCDPNESAIISKCAQLSTRKKAKLAEEGGLLLKSRALQVGRD